MLFRVSGFVVNCLWFVVCCLLCVDCCWLVDICCMLFVVVCCLLFVVSLKFVGVDCCLRFDGLLVVVIGCYCAM